MKRIGRLLTTSIHITSKSKVLAFISILLALSILACNKPMKPKYQEDNKQAEQSQAKAPDDKPGNEMDNEKGANEKQSQGPTIEATPIAQQSGPWKIVT